MLQAINFNLAQMSHESKKLNVGIRLQFSPMSKPLQLKLEDQIFEGIAKGRGAMAYSRETFGLVVIL